MDFLEGAGVVFLMVLVLAVIIFGMTFLDDIVENEACESLGHATEIHLRGENYCVAFEDGILKTVGILDVDDGEYVIEREFVLVGSE